jgi:hypothetical protein
VRECPQQAVPIPASGTGSERAEVASVAEGNPPRARVLPPQASPLRLVLRSWKNSEGRRFIIDVDYIPPSGTFRPRSSK